MQTFKKMYKWCRIIKGIIMSEVYQISPEVKAKLNQIAAELVGSSDNFPKAKVFVMTVGFTHSGKETLVSSHHRLCSVYQVETNKIHDLLNKNFDFLKDDNTVRGKAYWERQNLTEVVRQKLLEQAFKQEVTVINRSCNLKKDKRQQRLNLAKKFGYKTIIIWVKCDEAILLTRLQEADKRSIVKGGEPPWVELYEKEQKARFEKPEPSEADELIIFESSKDDPKQLAIKSLE
jgi:predicted kinase